MSKLSIKKGIKEKILKSKKRLFVIIKSFYEAFKAFWKWREIPVTLVALKGNGIYRLENTNSTVFFPIHKVELFKTIKIAYIFPYRTVHFTGYLARIQPWCRWHITVQWPFFISFHIFYRKADVIEFLKYKENFGIKKLFNFYMGFRRDKDKKYRFRSYIGGSFK